MATYRAPLRDMQFVLHELLNVESTLTALPGYQDANRDLIDSVLEEAAKFAQEVLFPLNRSGDEEGCTLVDGEVTTPKGFKAAYDQFREGGWTGLDCDPTYGGQGLPKTLGFPISEMNVSANMAWSMYPGLSHGAYAAIHAHGSDEQKATYLPPLVDGSWTGTMCLTEPHCGTDLGLIKSRAEPLGDGSYRISGTKIFISSGEHDLADNIVHLVLARLPDAPRDIKGISLFIVPKFLPANGGVGERNPVSCGSLEHKMGIKANATCVMNFDGAVGYLIGEPNRGMSYMFTMMNAARLGVGMQGLGLNEVSYQSALAYAKDRLQMRALTGPVAPEKPADPIIVHPDVRRMLLTMKAYAEAGRAFSSWLAVLLDVEDRAEDTEQRQDAADLLALLIPVAKAFMTDNGFETTNHGVQIFGGHGFIREWGMEQFVRDARISLLYEGTNGIQAMDLIGRKVLMDQGAKLRKFTKLVHRFCQEQEGRAEMAEFVAPLAALNKQLGEVTMKIGMAAMQNKDEAGAAASDYLRLLGHLVYGWFWARMVAVSLPKADEPFYAAKISTARFYYAKLMPETHALTAKLATGAQPLMSLDQDHFAF
ncbi:acyl-CoA dehydrogenase oxidoreductase [Chitinimonas prasina]|uniref:Acyl-CoA dehydrogenase oxidoreductase n=1 Tax=Chitinimonas prasina TaxID=1434937 RepID=A0ABQ5YCQ6_9NEIS|nr:acyl-CoA dehydrogenase C-terminal domain-containing protein [Chitinimonas prasina]GLR11674.1 acyl-CoA dehydrogenase oxidoreductase [Chitinimonas prasina]